MKKIGLWMAAACTAGLLSATSTPAQAGDVCLQFSGVSCDLSGDLGYFRLLGAKFPTNNKKAISVHGRACSTGSVTATLVMSHDSSSIHLGGSFVCDATFGAITADFAPGSTALGGTATNAYASYGDVGLGTSCTVTIVDCATEP